jgi:NADPH-dependent 2,4-dienoyl-CoA reductase/sulfur reductase-like enzyme
MTLALGCSHHWNAQQGCLVPDVNEWGQTSLDGIYVAGDAAGIGGAKTACVRGELVALGVAQKAARLTAASASAQAEPLRDKLGALLRLRTLLDALYPPLPSVLEPSDETIVCRCEELTAGDIRKAAAVGDPGPNQVKAFTRAGMGPCQGRQCGYTVAHIVAATRKQPVQDVGFYRIRPPLKPLTIGEIASLHAERGGK